MGRVTFAWLAKDHLQKYIFLPIGRQNGKWLNELGIRNALVQKASSGAFSYKGIYYTVNGARYNKDCIPLHDSLKGEMDEFNAKELVRQTKHYPMVANYLSGALSVELASTAGYLIDSLISELKNYPDLGKVKTHFDPETKKKFELQYAKHIDIVKYYLTIGLLT